MHCHAKTLSIKSLEMLIGSFVSLIDGSKIFTMNQRGTMKETRSVIKSKPRSMHCHAKTLGKTLEMLTGSLRRTHDPREGRQEGRFNGHITYVCTRKLK